MPDQNIETAYRLFTWRILSNRIPPWEFEQIKSKLERWEDWCWVWCEVGEKFAKLGDDALASNRRLSAGDASPPEHAYRLEREVQGPTATLVFEDGVHSCNNLHYIVRPLVADWLAETI
jgi:hypothetical protein